MYRRRDLSNESQVKLAGTWLGLNRVEGSLSSGEIRAMKNMSSDNFPLASPRKPRELIANGIESPQRLFSAGDRLGYISAGKLFYMKDGTFTEIGDVGTVSTALDYNGRIVMFPSNKVYDYTLYTFDDFGDSTSDRNPAIGYYDESETLITPADDIFVRIIPPGRNVRGAFYTIGEVTTAGAFSVNDSDVPTWSNALRTVVAHAYNGTTYIGTIKTDIGASISVEGATRYRVSIGCSWLRSAPSGMRYDSAPGWRDMFLDNEDYKIWVTGSSFPDPGTVPIIDYACVDNNRIFAGDKNDLYASAQGSYSDWTTYTDASGNPDPTGAYAEKLDTPQDISGIAKYRGNVVIFKPDLMYEALGNRPPYRVVEVAKTGCIDNRTIVEVNSVLYWLGRKGIYAYTGGQPRLISEKLNKEFISGIAGTDGRKYYISAYDGSEYVLYVYDTFNGLWHTEDDFNAVGFAYARGFLYALNSDGGLYKFDGGNERVSWEFETQRYTFTMPNVKTIRRLYIRAEMDPCAKVDVYIDGYRASHYNEKGFSLYEFKVDVRKKDSFSILFKGTGNAKIHDIHADVTTGTDKHKTRVSVFRR